MMVFHLLQTAGALSFQTKRTSLVYHSLKQDMFFFFI